LKAIFSNATGKTIEASLAKFECHDQHFDIQLCISGIETIGWKPRKNEFPMAIIMRRKMYDFQLMNRICFSINQRAIRNFSEDVHAPMIGDGSIKTGDQ
jgi:beta-galactosidase beta subunit